MKATYHGNEITLCGDCQHYQRCAWLLGALKTWNKCDWIPSRFIPIDKTITMQYIRRTDALGCIECGKIGAEK